MIEEFGYRRLVQSSRREDPVVLASGRAVLPCGCEALAGTRLDTMEPVTVLRPCSFKHEPLVTQARELLVEAIRGKRPGSQLEVANEVLEASAVGRTL